MQYNKSKLYLFICISGFFLILAFTLFYSFGYKYDFTTGKSYQTGAIVLRAQPTDAVITKDGETAKQSGILSGIWSTFVKIENLQSKSYNIKVNKDGYDEWQKNVTISAGQVGKYESIVLLKKEYKTLPAFPDVTLPDTANVWMFPEKNKIIFNGKIGNIEGLFMLNLENDDQKILLDKDQLALMGKLQGVLWTQDDDKMMVKAGDNFYIIDLGDNYKTYLVSSNISKLIGTNGTVFYAQDKYVFYNQAGSIFLFNYITKENVQILGGVSSFYVYGGNIYFFKSAEAATPTLYSVNPSSPTNETKVSVMPEGYDSAQSFTVQKNGNYSLLLSATNLYVQDGDNPMEKINSNVAIAKFFQGGKRILYFNDNEIWIYYTEDKDNQPIESKGENQLLSRFSGKLSNIYLYSDEEHLFFQQDDAIDFTEMDGRDNRNTFKVMDNAEGSNIFYSRGKNMIYFLSGSKLFKIDLKEA